MATNIGGPLIDAQQTLKVLAATPASKNARSTATLLGFTYTPGDVVHDTVSGQPATVLHGSHKTVFSHASK